MNEIEKMYSNVGIKKRWSSTPYGGIVEYYPTFTAGKQIGLIKWLAKRNFVVCDKLGGWFAGVAPAYNEKLGIVCKNRVESLDSFSEVLVRLINNLWQSLTEKEKQQVKGILE